MAKKCPQNVLVYTNENGEMTDMIGFHNHFFVREMKKYVLPLKDMTPQTSVNVFSTPRPVIPSLITESPLKVFTNGLGKNIHHFASPMRKNSTDFSLTPCSAALFVREEHDDLRKMLKSGLESQAKKLDLSERSKENSEEKPNNSLLSKIRSRYEGFQQNLHLKVNSKVLGEEQKVIGKGLKRTLFEDGKIEESEENGTNNSFNDGKTI